MGLDKAARLCALAAAGAILVFAMSACGRPTRIDILEASTVTQETIEAEVPTEVATHTPDLIPEPTDLPQSPVTATPSPSLDRSIAGIAFVSNDKISIISADGSTPQRLVPQRVQPDGLAWSPDGRRIAYIGWRGGSCEVFIVDVMTEGAEPFRLTETSVDEMHPAWSPDGTRIAFCAERGGGTDIYVINVDGTGEQQLTNHEAEDCAPDWSPDGTRIAFESNRDGNREIYLISIPLVGDTGVFASAGDAAVQRLTYNEGHDYAPAWSPDGTRIAFYSGRGGAFNLYVMDADGTNERQLTSDNLGNEWWPSWSPDGTQIAYSVMQASYLHEIYVMSVNAQGQGSNQRRLTVSTADDWFPAWRPEVRAEVSASTTPVLASQVDTVTFFIPPGISPTIDGTLSPGEWDDAVSEFLSDDSELLLMHADGYLYLGIRSATRESFATNIYVEDNGNVRILHASAALGTAVYQQGIESWQQTRGFDWKCRYSSPSEAAVSARAAYLQEERWVAGLSLMGTPNEVEYQIELASTPRHVAVSLARSSRPDERVFWPATLDDDCITPTPGGIPPVLHFSLDQWAVIDLSL